MCQHSFVWVPKLIPNPEVMVIQRGRYKLNENPILGKSLSVTTNATVRKLSLIQCRPDCSIIQRQAIFLLYWPVSKLYFAHKGDICQTERGVNVLENIIQTKAASISTH